MLHTLEEISPNDYAEDFENLKTARSNTSMKSVTFADLENQVLNIDELASVQLSSATQGLSSEETIQDPSTETYQNLYQKSKKSSKNQEISENDESEKLYETDFTEGTTSRHTKQASDAYSNDFENTGGTSGRSSKSSTIQAVDLGTVELSSQLETFTQVGVTTGLGSSGSLELSSTTVESEIVLKRVSNKNSRIRSKLPENTQDKLKPKTSTIEVQTDKTGQHFLLQEQKDATLNWLIAQVETQHKTKNSDLSPQPEQAFLEEKRKIKISPTLFPEGYYPETLSSITQELMFIKLMKQQVEMTRQFTEANKKLAEIALQSFGRKNDEEIKLLPTSSKKSKSSEKRFDWRKHLSDEARGRKKKKSAKLAKTINLGEKNKLVDTQQVLENL